jgi:hypothetical protein
MSTTKNPFAVLENFEIPEECEKNLEKEEDYYLTSKSTTHFIEDEEEQHTLIDSDGSTGQEPKLTEVKRKEEIPSIFEDVISSITDPLNGKDTLPFNRGVLLIINGSTLALLILWILLFVMLPFGSDEQMHVGVMIFVTLAFTLTFQWFLSYFSNLLGLLRQLKKILNRANPIFLQVFE